MRTNRSFGWLLLAVLTAAPVNGQDNSAEALRITTEAAKDYDFQRKGEREQRLKLHPRSVLHWSNPVAGEIYGNVFVWVDTKGRPAVIGSILQWFAPMDHGSHEFHSLADVPVIGTRDGRAIWDCQSPGVDWQLAGFRPRNQASSASLLRQARTLAREFEVTKTDREQVTRRLRLMTQPIYQHHDADERFSGALFAFVQGTDPEAIVWIHNDAKEGWRYAFVRMNSVALVARRQDTVVWSVQIEPWSKVKNGQEPYVHFGPFGGTR
ncbi:MAG: hypothetical protein AAGA03_13650 [Planctomycetota bacterium]